MTEGGPSGADAEVRQGTGDPAYRPIDCGLHDRLLAHATLRRTVSLAIREPGGERRVLRARIVDVFTRGSSEFLRTEGGEEVRLDRLEAVDGVRFAPEPPATAPEIAPMAPAHWPRVAAILAEGIATGHATFETEVPTWDAWDAGHLDAGRLVALDPGGRPGAQVVGWAALSPVSGRCVYAGVAEVSVYVAEVERGRGTGGRLLQGLVTASEGAGIWTLQAGIFPENDASLRMHRAAGFRVVGRRERVGQLAGRWRDVVLLERRSDRVGVD
jgi:L-amino acid N-acyltransferase YncA/transcriptional antiterminator Rof (Rho-off)